MKKIAVLLCLSVFYFGNSQETLKPKENSILNKKNEVKVGAIQLLAGPIFEGTYEYIYSKDFTFGSSLLANLQNKSSYYEDFSITPFARFYFQESKEYGAQGFLVEGFIKYYSGNKYVYYYNLEENKNYNATAIGLSLGKKWVNNSGFVFEILAGVGRTLGSSTIVPDAVFRGDLNIGYRF